MKKWFLCNRCYYGQYFQCGSCSKCIFGGLLMGMLVVGALLFPGCRINKNKNSSGCNLVRDETVRVVLFNYYLSCGCQSGGSNRKTISVRERLAFYRIR